MFKDCVPPTDHDGRLTGRNHPLNPPANLSARPYPYGPPVPAVAWRISHAKRPMSGSDTSAGSESLERSIENDVERDADGDQVAREERRAEGDGMGATRSGVFGFDDRDRHAPADPDIGWNLPS
jgi:hypothetical protein